MTVPLNPQTRQLAESFVDAGLVGFLGFDTAGEAAAHHVAPCASLGFGEGVDAFQCVGADAEALHLPGGLGHAVERSTTLDNVLQRDTVMV